MRKRILALVLAAAMALGLGGVALGHSFVSDNPCTRHTYIKHDAWISGYQHGHYSLGWGPVYFYVRYYSGGPWVYEGTGYYSSC